MWTPGLRHALRRFSVAGLSFVSLSACFDLVGTPRGPKIALSYWAAPPAVAPGNLLVDIGGRRVELPAPTAGQVREVDVRGLEYGDAVVTLMLRTTSDDVLATDTFSHTFERDSEHWIGARVGTVRPIGMCIGMLRVVPITASADTLFVTYSSVPNGAIC